MRYRKSTRLGKLSGEATRERRGMVAANNADRQVLKRASAAGKLHSPVPGVYFRRELWDALSQNDQLLYTMRALQKLHPAWVFAGTSAAVAHGLSVSYELLWPIRVAVSRRQYAERGAVARQIVVGDDSVEKDGVHVTSLARTTFDCLREMSFADGLAVADTALRIGGMTRQELADVLGGMPRNSVGWSHALETAVWADARAESGGESIARAQMIRLGYEVPRLQVEVNDPLDNKTVYRGDFGWKMADDTWLLGELDGHEKYVNPKMTKGRDAVDVLTDERLRESRISANGTRVMRFSFADVMDENQFRQILEAYGVPKAQQAPPVDVGERYVPSWRRAG